MSGNDPVHSNDDDRTILVPRPGAGRTPAAVATVTNAPDDSGSGLASSSGAAAKPSMPLAAVHLSGSGLNPVARAANPLLDLIVPLRSMASYGNLEDLRLQLVHAIKNFEHDLRARRIDPELIAAGRYVLCTFLDETISSTPWGGNGVWATKSLLVHFHNEAWGGEKVFVILQRLSQNPRANLHALELIYLCLALGLEGRYRVREGGRDQLETLRERLRQMIQMQRGPYERDLSVRWKGVGDRRSTLLRAMPLWVLASVLGTAFVGLHLGLSYTLNRESDPVFNALHQVHIAAPPAPAPAQIAVLPPVPVVRLSTFLASDIARGLVSVTETPDRSVVTLRGDGVFGSGSADILPGVEPLIGRIGDALKNVPGRVVVIGHTDDVRSFSARFPSNWELSKARAASVLKQLASRAGPDTRYTVIGRGETEPLVANDSAANRARNRRVDIILLTPAAAQ